MAGSECANRPSLDLNELISTQAGESTNGENSDQNTTNRSEYHGGKNAPRSEPQSTSTRADQQALVMPDRKKLPSGAIENGAAPSTARPPPPKLILEADNLAQQAWRNHEMQKGTIRIPDALVWQDSTHERIAREHGAFIFAGDDQRAEGDITFGIWGEDDAVHAARADIIAWIKEWRQSSDRKSSDKRSHGASKFAKVLSLTPAMRIRLQRRWRREVKKQMFRQRPPTGVSMGAIGAFHWPIQEYRPEDVFGTSCEALDPIRMDNSCYIVFNSAEAKFTVYGTFEDVPGALVRLRRAFFQIAARQIPAANFYLWHWPDVAGLPTHVHMEQYETPVALSGEATLNSQERVPRGYGFDFDSKQIIKKTAEAEAAVKESLLLALQRLHYYRGDLELRVRLGTFLATRYRRATQPTAADSLQYPLSFFENMAQESQFLGRVTQEIGNKEIEETALSILSNSNRMLQPEDGVTEDLKEVRPLYTASFTFADQAGDIVLTISWRESQDASSTSTTFEEESKKWTRLERDTNMATSIYDARLTNLQTSFAWRFGIDSTQPIEEARLPNGFAEFGHSVKIDANLTRNANLDALFVSYRATGPNLKNIHQRMSYRYHILTSAGWPSDYTLELSYFQDRAWPSRGGGLNLLGGSGAVYEPRWSVNVFRNTWDTMFSENARLPIGEMAQWDHDVGTWFPEDTQLSDEVREDGKGFEELMEKLKEVAKVLQGAQTHNTADG